MDIKQLDLTFENAFWLWFEATDKEGIMSEANKSVYKSVFSNHCVSLYNIKILELKTINIQNCIDSCNKGFNIKNI